MPVADLFMRNIVQELPAGNQEGTRHRQSESNIRAGQVLLPISGIAGSCRLAVNSNCTLQTIFD
jgi:hypothetical protein